MKFVTKRAGVDQDRLSTHSLRVGGETEYANSPEGREIVDGCMGMWRSIAGDRYVYAGEGIMDRTGVEIGRETGDE